MSEQKAKVDQQNIKGNNSQKQPFSYNPIPNSEEKYGDNFQVHLLEQYKLYIEMMDRVSSRRSQMNTFYISLLSGLLAFISLANNKEIFTFQEPKIQGFIISMVAVLGLVLCSVWYSNIQSYKQLNSGKFKVIFEMEKFMPFACYEQEWNFLKSDKKNQSYIQQTQIEKYIPFILSIPYLGLLIYSLIIFFR